MLVDIGETSPSRDVEVLEPPGASYRLLEDIAFKLCWCVEVNGAREDIEIFFCWGKEAKEN